LGSVDLDSCCKVSIWVIGWWVFQFGWLKAQFVLQDLDLDNEAWFRRWGLRFQNFFIKVSIRAERHVF
jgi:hypothetical protein